MSSMIETKIAKILLETRAIKLSPDHVEIWRIQIILNNMFKSLIKEAYTKITMRIIMRQLTSNLINTNRLQCIRNG